MWTGSPVVRPSAPFEDQEARHPEERAPSSERTAVIDTFQFARAAPMPTPQHPMTARQGSMAPEPGPMRPRMPSAYPPVDPRWSTQASSAPPPQPMPARGSYHPPPLGVAEQPRIQLTGKPDPRLVLLADPDSARATSFRLLRDNLLAKRLPRILAVSSPGKQEGKTTCAVNLALALSEGARVLLIDANLFAPALDKIFCIEQGTPVSSNSGPWLTPYRIVEFSNSLHIGALVLPAGVTPPRFEKRWFEPVFAGMCRIPYDYVIVDAGSFSESPTVGQLVAMADATLVSVRSGVTTARALRRATEQIPQGRAIGVTLLDTKPTA